MIKSLVKAILEGASAYEWSLQGFGMLRLHLSDEIRLNVWDSRYRVPNVSLIHTHPWNFESLIVAGKLRNQRYVSGELASSPYSHAVIKPGTAGGMIEQRPVVFLSKKPEEEYIEGQIYSQLHDEIHLSDPEDGTITLNTRRRIGVDAASVYWPSGEDWVSGWPRNATEFEIYDITSAALNRWF